ncbi:MAG TPA: proton-conducting transporter membrane subunit, partial [Terricaulis sp.]|nr:proton-conducting transporter membrane subunit [Terricaulis sp.]
MAEWPLLSIITFLPAAGALLILLARSMQRGEDAGYDRGVRLLTLLVTLLTFAISLVAFAAFDPSLPGYQLVENVPWAFGAGYRMGVDSLAMTLVMLTTFLTPICILASWVIEKQVSSYMVLFLILETLMIGVFCAQDIILFYVFFEAGLIPMFIIIGVWGGERRVYAAFKFFLYTLLGSIL